MAEGLQGLGGLGANNQPNQNDQTQAQPSTGVGGLGGIGGGIGGQQPAPAQPAQPAAPAAPVQPAQTAAPAPKPAGNVVSLKKGQKVSLKKCAADAGVPGVLSKIHVGLGWDVNKYDGGAEFDLDVFTFALKADGKVRDTGDFIFFNNPKSAEGAIALSGDNRTGAGDGDDEAVLVDLSLLPAEITNITFAITINEAGARNQNFGMVDNSFVRILDQATGTEIMRYDLSEDYSLETALVVGEVYNHNGEWKFKANGSGFNDGLPALCACYGIDAEE